MGLSPWSSESFRSDPSLVLELVVRKRGPDDDVFSHALWLLDSTSRTLDSADSIGYWRQLAACVLVEAAARQRRRSISLRRPTTRASVGPDNEVVKIAAHLESICQFDPADLHRLKPGRSDQVLDLLAGTVVIGRIEEDRGLGRPVGRGLQEIGRHGSKGHRQAAPRPATTRQRPRPRIALRAGHVRRCPARRW